MNTPNPLDAKLELELVPTATKIVAKLIWRLTIDGGIDEAGPAGVVHFTPNGTNVTIWSDFVKPSRLLQVDLPFGNIIINNPELTDEEVLSRGSIADRDSAVIDQLFGNSVIDRLQTASSRALALSVADSPTWEDFGQKAVLASPTQVIDTQFVEKVGRLSSFDSGHIGIDHSMVGIFTTADAVLKGNDLILLFTAKSTASSAYMAERTRIRATDARSNLIGAVESLRYDLLARITISAIDQPPLFVTVGEDLPFAPVDRQLFIERQAQYCGQMVVSGMRSAISDSVVTRWRDRCRQLWHKAGRTDLATAI